ncbi:MAG: RNA polymerase sigma factor [Balneolales bacterium]
MAVAQQPMSDNALMIEVKNGDLDKLGVVTSRRDISEDLVQAVFERIIRYRSSYSGHGAFSTWIFQIARHLHADHWQKTDKRAEDGEFEHWESLQSDNVENPGENGEESDRMLLQRALKKLGDGKKQALILSRFEGFTYREISEIMGCTESAVKVRVFRAINELKEIITHLRKQKKYD